MTVNNDYYQSYTKLYILCVLAAINLISHPLLAGGITPMIIGDHNPISKVMCNIIVILMGPIGQGISTVAVIFIGVGAFFGKVSWGIVVVTGVGIAVVLGADRIVMLVSDSSFTCV